MRKTEKGSTPGLFARLIKNSRLVRTSSKTNLTAYQEKSDQTARSNLPDHAVKDGTDDDQGLSTPSTQSATSPASDLKAKHGPRIDEAGNTYPEGGSQAWICVAGSWCSMFCGFGVLNTIGIFNSYISTHQLSSYSESTVSWIFSIYVFLVFFCGLQIGPIFDAKGPRMLVILGSICLVSSMFLIGICTEYWHFILAFSILGGLGSSLLFTPAIAAVAHYFHRRRATATGLATTAGSFGGIIFPLMLQRLIPRIGWAWATRVLAFILLALCLTAVALIRSRLSATDRAKAAARTRRECATLVHTNDSTGPESTASTAQTTPTDTGTGTATNWRAMLPDPRIFLDGRGHVLLTALAIFFLEWGLFVPVTYLPSYALSANFSPTFAYQLIAIFNAGSCFGRYLPGLVADRVGRYNTMLVTVVLCIIGVFAFWLAAELLGDGEGMHEAKVGLIVTFSILFGFASGSNISLTPICVGQLCDTRQYGLYYATSYTLVSFGSLTGIPIAGALLGLGKGKEHEWWGVVVFTGGCYVAALACFGWVRVGRVGWGWRTVW